MGEFTKQIAIVFGILVACFAGPGAAIYVLLRRKAKARQGRRSQIDNALLRGPGHSLREQIDETHNDLTWDLVLLMVVPLLALATFLAHSHLRGLPQTVHLAPVFALAAIAFIAYMLRKRLKPGTALAADNACRRVRGRLAQPARHCAATAWSQPPTPVGPHAHPPACPHPEARHPCGFAADLPEPVPNPQTLRRAQPAQRGAAPGAVPSSESQTSLRRRNQGVNGAL